MDLEKKKTPKPFITACDKFIYLEILNPKIKVAKEIKSKTKRISKDQTSPLSTIDQKLINLITDSVSDLSDESGWTFLGNLGNHILKKKTDFDPRNYGFPKLFPLIQSIDKFEIDERETGVNNIRHIYLKNK